jgi:hypothetical protein
MHSVLQKAMDCSAQMIPYDGQMAKTGQYDMESLRVSVVAEVYFSARSRRMLRR